MVYSYRSSVHGHRGNSQLCCSVVEMKNQQRALTLPMVFIPEDVMLLVSGGSAALARTVAGPGSTFCFYTWLTDRRFCVNPLSQQQRHRNAQNMEGAPTIPAAGRLRNPFSGHREGEIVLTTPRIHAVLSATTYFFVPMCHLQSHILQVNVEGFCSSLSW